MKIKLLTAITATIILLNGCDKIEGPYGNAAGNNQNNGDTSETILRKILVEDFTGHTCGNCPRAAESLGQIEDLYGDQIVAIAIHAGFFAEPTGSFFSEDYRTTVGNDLDQAFGNSAAGLPNGLINRKEYDGQSIIQHTDWASKTSEWINLPPDLVIRTVPQYNPATRELEIDVTTTILQNMEESLNIVYYLTEDSIQSAQKDYSLAAQYEPNYYHRHVLRGSMNGAWGNVLGEGIGYTANQELNSSASFTIPSTWNASKVAVVTVVYKTGNKEVIQAEETKIQ